MKTAPPQKPLTNWPPFRYQSRAKVALAEGNKSWAALANTWDRKDPWDIIVYNFETRVPEIVNHYMAQLIGCTKSNDGIKNSFSPEDRPGFIYIPPSEWTPAMGPEKTDINRYEQSVLSHLSSLNNHPAHFLNAQGVYNLVREKIYVDGFRRLGPPCEYTFADKLFVRDQHLNFPDIAWLIKEAMHIWHGPHGLNSGTYLDNETLGWIALAAWWTSMFDGPGAKQFRAYFELIRVDEGRREKIAAFQEAMNYWEQRQAGLKTNRKPSADMLKSLARVDPSYARRNHLHNKGRRQPQAR